MAKAPITVAHRDAAGVAAIRESESVRARRSGPSTSALDHSTLVCGFCRLSGLGYADTGSSGNDTITGGAITDKKSACDSDSQGLLTWNRSSPGRTILSMTATTKATAMQLLEKMDWKRAGKATKISFT